MSRVVLTIDDLCLLYLSHCDGYYRKNGEPTGETENIRRALRYVVAHCGQRRARDFTPATLIRVRQSMIEAGLVRKAINIHVMRIRRMFRWAVATHGLPETVWRSLTAVMGLSEVRSEAKESTPVLPVDEGTVNDTLPHLSRVVGDMVRLQLLTGARPGEICSLRSCDITRGTNGVWTYRPEKHKTEHHGRARRIYIGPAGQAVLSAYLERDPVAFCFSPAESQADKNATRKQKRQTPMTPSQAARKAKGRPMRLRFTKDTYNRAIQRGCEAAFGMPMELRNIKATVQRLPVTMNAAKRDAEKARLSAAAAAWRAEHCWSPNQLRHSRATMIRERYGIEAAQTVLGHADPRVTEIYAERDFAMAARIMQEIG